MRINDIAIIVNMSSSLSGVRGTRSFLTLTKLINILVQYLLKFFISFKFNYKPTENTLVRPYLFDS